MDNEEIVKDMFNKAFPDQGFHEELLMLDEVNLEELFEEVQELDEAA